MIHKYFMNGYFIVIDVNSGAIHAVEEIVYDILDYYKTDNVVEMLKNKYDVNELNLVLNEVKALEKQGLLFSPDIYEEMAENLHKREPVIKALCMHIAHDCNLKCTYCFAGEGEYKGARSLMSAEVGKKAIDFILANSGNRRNLEIDFFGGEPLMNFDVVKEIVAYGREKEASFGKNIRFTLTTNGLLLDDEKIEYINEVMDNVVLSIDGRKHINDKMRPNISGGGSYDIITPKFKKLAETRKDKPFYFRGTFTRENLDFSKDILHLADLGFSQISVEPVVSDPGLPYSLQDSDYDKICAEYEELAVIMTKRKDFNFFHFMIDLTGGPCATKRLVGCGAGSEYLAITPEGELYPCHQFVGDKNFQLGTIDEGIVNHDLYKDFEGINVYSKEDCKNCFGKFYCSGGCAANGYLNKGDIKANYDLGCKLQLKRIECAIMLKVANEV